MAIDLNELAAAIGQLILRFRLRRRTAAEWTSLNEILLSAEMGLESDTNNIKIGDGTTAWNDLDYFGGAPGLTSANAGLGIAIDASDPLLPIISATGSGGGTSAAWDALYVAALGVTPVNPAAGADATLFDVMVTAGDFVCLGFAMSKFTATLTAATNATYTVPSGKKAYLVDARFDSSTGLGTTTTWTYYKHELFNVTTSTAVAGPGILWNSSPTTSMYGTVNPQWLMMLRGAASDQLANFPWPVPIADAGDTLVAACATAGDGFTRVVAGAYIIAIL